eukprot:Selendium_serpulae@DN6157_c7_g1_i4.p1
MANKYLVKSLENTIVEQIKKQLSEANCLEVFLWATASNCTALREAALTIAAHMKLCDLQQDPRYSELDREDMKSLNEAAAAVRENESLLTKAEEEAAKKWFENEGSGEPLCKAAKEGRLDVVKWLLNEKKGNIDEKDDCNQTPLHLAAMAGRLQVVKFLLDRGADVEAKSGNNKTPLHYAAWEGHLQVVKFLVEDQRANVEAKDENNRTPLHVAAWYGHLQVIKFLVDRR